MNENHKEQVAAGERFEFGENWSRFLQVLDDDRIHEAKNSLKLMLGVESLEGKTFLDIGSGSGLFSLAARSLGAKVTSFDFDPKSVACAIELKKRYFDGDKEWVISEGSVLDGEFIEGLGQYDIVYSWGVLHHTGQCGRLWVMYCPAWLRVGSYLLLYIMIRAVLRIDGVRLRGFIVQVFSVAI